MSHLGTSATLAATGIVVALMIWTSSEQSTAAAGASDSSSDAIALTNDESRSVGFTNHAVSVPGDSDQACITVTYDGAIAADVKMYGSTTFSSARDLGRYLTLTIEDVDDTDGCHNATVNATLFSTADLSVSPTSFTRTHTGWTDALNTNWTPSSPGATKTYRITVTLQDDNDAQGLTTNANFTWEAQPS